MDAGLARREPVWKPNAGVSDAILARLEVHSLVDLFEAVRALHALIAEDGESPHRLWALSRAYANLGQECQWHLNTDYAVFYARSLLYAQRLKVKAKDWAVAYLAQSYSWLMSGYPMRADSPLKELERRMVAHRDTGQPEKDWAGLARLLRACIAYDTQAMDRAMREGGGLAQLAALWRIRSVEFIDLPRHAYDVFEQTRAVSPYSLRNAYPIYALMDPRNGYVFTRQVPAYFGAAMAERLRTIDGLAPGVARVLDGAEEASLSFSELAQVADELTKPGPAEQGAGGAQPAPGPAEFSHAVLGRLIRQANTLHLFYLVYNLQTQLGQDAGELVDAVGPLIEGEPLAPLIAAFDAPKGRATEHAVAMLARFEPTDLNPYHLYPLANQLPYGRPFANGKDLDWWINQVRLMNAKESGYWLSDVRWIHPLRPNSRREVARLMRPVDPHHPARVTIEIQTTGYNRAQVLRLGERYGQHPTVAIAMRNRLTYLQALEPARDYAQIAADAIPLNQTLIPLARLELRLGNVDAWQAAMEKVLMLPQSGLQTASINRVIAATLMNDGRYEAALPFARTAAESNALWALRVYMTCLTGLERFDQAAAVARKAEAGYGRNQVMHWEVWSGRADPQSAVRFLDERTLEPGMPEWQRAVIRTNNRVAAGAFEQAFGVLEQPGDQPLSPRELLMGVCLAQHLGNAARRDAYLDRLTNLPADQGFPMRFSLLAPLLKDGLAEGGSDEQGLEAWAQEHDPERMVTNMYVLWFRAASGQWDQVKEPMMLRAANADFDTDWVLWLRSVSRAYDATESDLCPRDMSNAHSWIREELGQISHPMLFEDKPWR